MKKLLIILGSLGITASVGGTVVSCEFTKSGVVNLGNLKSPSIEKFADQKSIDLEYLKANKNLITGLEKINPSEIKFENFKNDEVKKTITVDIVSLENSKTVSGSIKNLEIKVVEYVKKNVKNIITEMSLGEVSTKNTVPNSQELINAIKKSNFHSLINNVFSQTEGFSFDNVKNDSFTLTISKESKYLVENEKIDFKYTLKSTATEKIKLETLLKNKNIGEFKISREKPRADEVMEKLILSNSDLVRYKSQLEVTDIQSTKATIKVKSNSNELVQGGSVEVNFILRNKLEDIVIENNLGKFLVEKSLPTKEEVIDRLIEKNPNIGNFKSSLTILGNLNLTSATISVKSDSVILIPDSSITVTYVVESKLPTLKSLIKVDKVGIIQKTEEEFTIDDFKVIFIEKNPEIAEYMNDLKMKMNTSFGSVDITVIPTSEKLSIFDSIKIFFKLVTDKPEPESKPESKPENKPENKPESKPESKPAVIASQPTENITNPSTTLKS
ncbi:lipoprotein [Spiroplasma endosymbiont of Panorpa germanica]|uniref:lipoprotein n=1 Tax=Spiroplasma endosymbiont of Panorpa germanica TaxID=3066314 RepID=UPI0030CA924A